MHNEKKMRRLKTIQPLLGRAGCKPQKNYKRYYGATRNCFNIS